MKKKLVSYLLASAMIATLFTGCQGSTDNTSNVSTDKVSDKENTENTTIQSTDSKENTKESDKDYDLTLYSILTTDPEFETWLADVESATGLNINVIAAPTDSDTRQQKITTILSTSDTTVDILEVNDEMATAFKNTGWLEPLNDTVMKKEILDKFPTGYVADMITSKDGKIVGVPGYSGYLAFWVNQQIMDEVGIKSIETKDEFLAYLKAATGNGRYGYGGSWEKTYVFNEIATFVNLFGGDYYDWSNPANKEALQFMYDMVNTYKVTPIDQITDKYEQMNQKFIDGKYGCLFMWGTGSDYAAANMLGSDKLHLAKMPTFTTNSIFTDSWSYVMNTASKNKEAATKFLEYMTSKEGMSASWTSFDRYPARADVANEIISDDNEIKQMYSIYSAESVVRGRPMLPQTMEFISDMGTIFQSYMQNKISLDEFCTQAQIYVDTYQ